MNCDPPERQGVPWSNNGTLTLHASFGANLYECLRAALRIAIDEEREVHFTHNDVTYVISIGEILEYIRTHPAS